MVACARKKKKRVPKHRVRINVPASTMLRDSTFPAGPVALDCEMVGVGENMDSALARATIVAYDGTVLYDVICRPDEVITDYRTKYSGIRASDMIRAIPFSAVSDQVKRILKDRIVVGHSIFNDFRVLHMEHPQQLVRDTCSAPYAKRKILYPPNKPISLRQLSSSILGRSIQRGEHDSAEDARANMEIYKVVENEWEADIKAQEERRQAKRRRIQEKRAEKWANTSASTVSNSDLLNNDAIWEQLPCDPQSAT